MDPQMEALDLECQQAKMPQVQTRGPEAHESENHDAERCEMAALEVPASIAWQDPEAEATRPIEVEVQTDEGRDAGARAAHEGASARDLDQFSRDEVETQLAAIRELMAQARARGVWLSLGEIAEATEFGEASVSAQLRHLRKAHHGGHRVEKRRRRRSGEGAVSTIRDERRRSIIWEYRVLPPGRTGPGAGRTGPQRRAAEGTDA